MSPLAGSDASRVAWLIALVALAIRLAFAALIPLTEDEAYYRLWALHPRFGYLDHPPMIAWWIAPGLALLPDGPLGVRFLVCLSGLIATILVADTVRQLGWEEATQTRAALWFNAMPLVGFGGVLATPDAPATLFWIGSLWALARVGLPETGKGRPGYWLLAGVFAGLGCLSKYTGLFLAPGVVLWLLMDARMRGWLMRPWPWLAALVAVLVFAPNVWWNATHEWASFAKQFGRADATGWQPVYVAELLVAQIVLISPVLALFVVRGFGRESRARLALVWVTLVPFAAYLVVHALRDSVQGNWPAPIYPALAMLAAVGGGLSGPRLWAWLAKAAAPLGIALSALVLAAAIQPQMDSFVRIAPLKQLRGWPDFMRDVEGARSAVDARWIGTVSYGTAANLALRTAIPVAQITERNRYLYTTPPNLAGVGLIVDLERRLSVKQLKGCFGEVQTLGQIDRKGPVRPVARYSFYRVSTPLADIASSGCITLERTNNAIR